MFVSGGKLFHHSNKRLGLPSLVAMCSLVLREQENIWHIWLMVGEFSFKEAGVAHPLSLDGQAGQMWRERLVTHSPQLMQGKRT